jgi:phenylalanyl-tRNA synthetase beta chain
MRVPLSWLKDYVDITLPVEELAHRLTMAGLEVAAIERFKVPEDRPIWDREKIVVGHVLEVKPHPNADLLVLAVVDHGSGEPETVVTGAPNIKVGESGIKVPFARRGALLYDGHSKGWELTTLKPAKIRGVRSEAMICSEKELGLRDAHEQVILLPNDAPVGMPLADYIDLTKLPVEDFILDLDLTPNLSRCFSMIGAAREVAALTGAELRLPSTEMVAEGPPIAGQVEVEIADPDLCSRYTATLIRGVSVGPSPYWMQLRLTLAGMRPINNIVDVTNYVMLEWGQPLHAFDYDQLRGREEDPERPVIIVRRARPGEEITTLDEVQRKLDPEMLLITDPTGPIAIAGVMGGYESEVRGATTNILLESANFNNISNRRTSQTLKLPSEASLRFGKGIPPSLTIPAISRASELMHQLAGATIARGYADAYPVVQETITVEITTAEVKRILGMEISQDEVLRTLRALEFRCKVACTRPIPEAQRRVSKAEGEGDGNIHVTVPDHRLDVTLPADLIEEVARIIGYEKIPATLMRDELPPQWRDLAREGEEQVRDILVGCGLQEVITYSLVGEQQYEKLLAVNRDAACTLREATPAPPIPPVPETQWRVETPRRVEAYPVPCFLPPESCVRIANPLTPEHQYMRTNLLGSLLDTLRDNLRYVDRVVVFEVANVYLPHLGEDLPSEPSRLGIAMTGRRGERTWTQSRGHIDFFDLKGVIEALLEHLGVSGYTLRPLEHSVFQPGRTAGLWLHPPAGPLARVAEPGRAQPAGGPIGVLGEVHPLVRAAFDLPDQRVALAEVDLEALLAALDPRRVMKPVSRHPAVFQDLAIVVDEGIPAEQVSQVIIKGGGELLAQAQLFDVYRGEQIPAGKKSLAYALTYQAFDRTLTDEEVARVQNQIVRQLRQELGAELRA